jgi:GH15 family glucan-1,4-alpha-glucosidase
VRPISDLALLGDCHGAALVGSDGSVDWWCAPRFDSRSAFGRILDPAAGHFAVRPVGDAEVRRAYRDATMVLDTTFTTATGVLRLTDALALEPGARGHEIGERSPHALVRHAEVLEGDVELEVRWAPRLEYGLVVPELEPLPGGWRTVGGPDRLTLHTALALDAREGTLSGRATLAAGDYAAFVVHHREGMTGGAAVAPLDARATLEDTAAGWRSWSDEHQAYEGPYADAVARSSLVLQALTYQPTGAVVAAATTSLPEILGGEANWDYRYAWLRDASLTLRALWIAACPTEATRFFDWMAAAVGVDPDRPLQIVFGVHGERDLTERELPHLAGYGDSAPVRVGNDAWRQDQLDVMGEILGAAHLLREQLGELSDRNRRFLARLADRAAALWPERDAGMWEARDEERHYTSSKLMCWVALDRAIDLAPRLGEHADVPAWERARDAVRAEILERAWCPARGAYAGAFGSDRLDASVLLMVPTGFLPAGDERMRATIEAVEAELSDGGLVRRWSGADEDEGAFVICSCWLAECWALAGEPRRARAILDTVLSHAGDLGLLAEEIDPRDGRLLGNTPQAFSHVGLITAAHAIGEAEKRS